MYFYPYRKGSCIPWYSHPINIPLHHISTNISNLISNDSEGFYYIVQQGDTLYEISQSLNVDIGSIIEINNLVEPYVIYPGQRIFIPGTPSPSGRIYVVQPGDTLYSIAQEFSTTVEDIADLNHIDNPDLIYSGQRIIIPRS